MRKTLRELRNALAFCLAFAKGKVLWKHAGYEPGDEKDIERQIQQALAKG